MHLIISLAQIHIQVGQPQVNYARAEEWIIEAAKRNSAVILLPELWSTGYDLPNGLQHSQSNREILKQLSGLARQRRIWIGGSLLETEGQKLYNTFYFISPETGEPVAKYRKIHLFRLMDEHQWLHAGDQPCLVQVAGVRAGLAVCYDLRFPELFRSYALAEAGLVFLPAEWPLARIAHWNVLLQARAIENQIFIAAANCVGQSGAETFGGHSALISPWGEILAAGGHKDEDLLTAEIDLDQVAQIRQRIPIFSDRRPDSYKLPPGT